MGAIHSHSSRSTSGRSALHGSAPPTEGREHTHTHTLAEDYYIKTMCPSGGRPWPRAPTVAPRSRLHGRSQYMTSQNLGPRLAMQACNTVYRTPYYIKPVCPSGGHGRGHRLALRASPRARFLSHREKHGATKPGCGSKRTVNR